MCVLTGFNWLERGRKCNSGKKVIILGSQKSGHLLIIEATTSI